MLFFYLAVLIPAFYWVVRLLGPEMFPSSRLRLLVQPQAFDIPQPKPVEASRPEASKADDPVEKLEAILSEKNKDINDLQRELKISHVQSANFDKIKSLLEEEIRLLREQNRIFRSELGIPPVASFHESQSAS